MEFLVEFELNTSGSPTPTTRTRVLLGAHSPAGMAERLLQPQHPSKAASTPVRHHP
jgi:hypothetical protein